VKSGLYVFWVIRFSRLYVFFVRSRPVVMYFYLSYTFLSYTFFWVIRFFFPVPAAFSSGLYVFYSKKFLIRRYDFPKSEKPREGKGREYIWLASARSKRLFGYLEAAQVASLDGCDVTVTPLRRRAIILNKCLCVKKLYIRFRSSTFFSL